MFAEGVSAKCEQIGNSKFLTDSILTGWIFSVLIILVVRFALRGGAKIVPSNGQAVIELIINGLRNIFEPVVGKHVFPYVFPLLLSYFTFVLIHNLSGMFPGIGSIGYKHDGYIVGFFRPASSDLNMTLALAFVSIIAWTYFCLRFVGPKGLYSHIFGNKANKNELPVVLYTVLFLVFFAVGFVECISILFRVVSLSFRLFGNEFGGENLLHHMYHFSEVLSTIPIIKYVSFLLPLPFYFLECLIGLIQAFVFSLLVAVYIGLICNHGDDEHEEAINESVGI